MNKYASIYVAGHRGLVGSAIVRCLQQAGFVRLITRTRAELDLTRQAAVQRFFRTERPDYVIMGAAKVGGIYANNTYPAEFIYQNLLIESNIIHAAFKAEVRGLLFLGSSCIYPKAAPQPMREEALLTGPLEPTNEPYAVAKIAGIKLCESYNRQYGTNFRAVMPTNLYGPYDNFHPRHSHVIPGLLRRFHEAKLQGAPKVEIWGSGEAKREFLHVDDLAEACLFVLQMDKAAYQKYTTPMQSHLNVGSGQEVSIRELAELVREVTGFEGEPVFNTAQPDGAPRKLLDTSKLTRLGWQAKISLAEGLRETYRWFVAHEEELRE